MYYGGKDYFPGLTKTKIILGLFSEKIEQAIMDIQKFTEIETLDTCMEVVGGMALSATQACQVIEKVLPKRPANILQEMSKTDRNALLHQLKLEEGLSIMQISRLTGVSFNIVKRA